MVVNLCLPPFQTTVQCNKLCADGYDVSNLVSEDPSLRRRGFKLEYFLRPPVQVTLGFHCQVEVCGVDIELWSGGMDQNSTTRRLEVHSSSDAATTSDPTTKGCFLQVGRCDVREKVLLCFRKPRFRSRATSPYHHPLPPPAEGAMLSDLWNRGVQSLGSVAQLRLSIVFSSAGVSLGFKTLAVWGLPAHSCTPEALEEFQRAHDCCYRQPQAPTLPPPSPNPPHPPSHKAATNPGRAAPDDEDAIPEEFLDPLTQELMVLPMVLPSGAVVNLSSLEEYQRREATWGRSPNDPFTGVPFTADSKPLPCPLLKARIDQVALRRGWRPGVCGGGKAEGAGVGAVTLGPQTSRLVLQTPVFQPQVPDSAPSPLMSYHNPSSCTIQNCHNSISNSLTLHTQSSCTRRDSTVNLHTTSSFSSRKEAFGNKGVTPDRHTSFNSFTSHTPSCTTRNSTVDLHTASFLSSASSSKEASVHQGQGAGVVAVGGGGPVQRRKRGLVVSSTSSSKSSQHYKKTSEDQQANSMGSHEERLSASLDAALSSALQGLPSYTCQKRRQGHTPHTGEDQCARCAVSFTRYLTSPTAYTLPCRHLLCRPCLTHKAPPNAGGPQIICPTCGSTAPASAVTRVHH
ncbi:hypothetical protein ACEWY4_012688 [Coilia grayii]|uniref:RING finger protein 37 n=1 Tax=Coilia grayii TaxID=363190 RepID=A0ABD1K178_9TELE